MAVAVKAAAVEAVMMAMVVAVVAVGLFHFWWR
jgi:hypothetical protein